MVQERKQKDIECGKVYRIYDLREPSDTLYVGSTTNPVNYRFATHIHSARYKNTKHRNHALCDYMIAEGIDNFGWELLQQNENTTMVLLRTAEQAFMDKLKPRFNKNRAFRTHEDMKMMCCKRSNEQYAIHGRVKVKCECGSDVVKWALKKHKETKKHLAYVALQKLEHLRI